MFWHILCQYNGSWIYVLEPVSSLWAILTIGSRKIMFSVSFVNRLLINESIVNRFSAKVVLIN